MIKPIFLFITSSLMFISCNNAEKTEKKEEELSKTEYKEIVNLVDTIRLKRQMFNKEIVCNGRLRAIEKGDISFKSAGVVAKIDVLNGSYVEKGDMLALLDTSEASVELEKAKRAMEKANIDLVDKLIGQGYYKDTTKISLDQAYYDDPSNVPALVLKNVKATSGYNNAKEALEAAQRRLDNCYLYAPFNGKTANIDVKIHERSKDRFCTLIDDSYFDVDFNLLEAEMNDIAVDQAIIVTPFIDDNKKFNGVITQVNPLVDDKGQVNVKAKMKNIDNYLVEGMNVKIIIQKQINDMFVVPKDAVVIRDGFSVLFRYIDGKARWTYVDVMMSNTSSHVVTGCVKKQTTISKDDIIITSGNLNLADDTAVTPK